MGQTVFFIHTDQLGPAPPAEWSGWNVSLMLGVAPPWPAEPVGVAQPATRSPIITYTPGRPLPKGMLPGSVFLSGSLHFGGHNHFRPRRARRILKSRLTCGPSAE
jgi:hypothetical protein